MEKRLAELFAAAERQEAAGGSDWHDC
jgi:hypothetical protein